MIKPGWLQETIYKKEKPPQGRITPPSTLIIPNLIQDMVYLPLPPPPYTIVPPPPPLPPYLTIVCTLPPYTILCTPPYPSTMA